MSSQNLDISTRQQILLTPQLQQAIRLLNMSNIEITQEIELMLGNNFILERERDSDEISSNNDEDNENFETTIEHLGELDFDADWNDSYEDWQEHDTHNEENIQDIHLPSLSEYLEEQINVMPIPEDERAAALILVHSLDDDGYFREGFAAFENQFPLHTLTKALKHLQQCNPTGVGARNVRECILLQLEEQEDSPTKINLRRICTRYFEFILRDIKLVQKRLALTETELDDALRLLRRFSPNPCAAYMPDNRTYIEPEIIVREKNGISYVEQNQNAYVNLKINKSYSSLVTQFIGHEKTLMQAQIQEAYWFLGALKKRAETIRQVATIIVAEQQDFFQLGELAMRPLSRSKVAKMLNIHESTVSRAVNGKYLMCKRGLFELRYFFSNNASEEQSNVALKALILELINNENSHKPLTDQELSEKIKKQGFTIARRTVAKYREALGIPTANIRKRHKK